MNTGSIDAIRAGVNAALQEACGVMLGAEPVDASAEPGWRPAFSGRVRVSGDLEFEVDLSLDEEAARRLVETLLGGPPPEAEAAALREDAVGELTNVVAGGTKSRLSGHACDLSLPRVSSPPQTLPGFTRLLHRLDVRPGGGGGRLGVSVLVPAA